MSNDLEAIRVELEALTIQDLRKRASMANVGLVPQHSKEDIINLLVSKSRTTNLVNEANLDAPVAPGKVRIQIGEGTGTATGFSQGEYAVEVSVNRRHFTIPRGVPVDIPQYILSGLKDATVLSMKCDASTGYMKVVKKVQSYPYSVIAEGPPAEEDDKFARKRNVRLAERQAYFNKHQRFPTERELRESKGLPVRDMY